MNLRIIILIHKTEKKVDINIVLQDLEKLKNAQ